MSVTLNGFAYDDNGNPIVATITAYTANTTTVQGSTSSSGVDGSWTISGLSDNLRYDVKATQGATVKFDKGKTTHGNVSSTKVILTSAGYDGTNGVWSQVDWSGASGGSTSWDTDGCFGATTNILTIQTPGKYLVNAYVQTNVPTVSDAYAAIRITKNGGDVTKQATNTVNGQTISLNLSDVVQFVANDVLALWYIQTTGNTVSITNASLTITRVSA